MVYKPEFGPAHMLSKEELKPVEPISKALTGKGSPFEWEERFINGRLQKVWVQQPQNSRSIWLAASENFGEREHLVYEDSRFTYAESNTEILQCANWLRNHFQVRKGDHIGIISRNTPEFVWSYFAISLLGAVPVIINAFSDLDTLVFSILNADVRVAIVDHERWAILKPALKTVMSLPNLNSNLSPVFQGSASRLAGKQGYTGLEGLVVFPRKKNGKVPQSQRDWANGKVGPRVKDWEDLTAAYGLPKNNFIPEPVDGIHYEDTSLLIFTSGTTGRPKGVLSTNRQQLVSVGTGGFLAALAILRRGGTLPPPESPGLNPNQASLLALTPLFHLTGLANVINTALRGSKLLLMHKYSAEAAAELIVKEKVKGVSGIGFMIKEIINAKSDVLKYLESSISGGAASAKEIPGEIQAKSKGTMSTSGYGMTEINVITSLNTLDEYVAYPTSVGRSPPIIDIKIVDTDTGVALPEGQIGEIWSKSPGNALGYYKRPDATFETFTSDGWVRTGDLGKTEDGLLYVLDRAKDMIIRGGENIACSEVENGVYNESRVLHCAAVPLPHPRYGEEVAVVCQLHEQFRAEGKRPTEEDIKIACAKTLPKHMIPSYIWIRDEDLPRNPTGKVQKRDLKEEVKARARAQAEGSLKAKL